MDLFTELCQGLDEGLQNVILILDVINEAGHFRFSIFKQLLGLICSQEIHNVSMLLQDSLLKNLKQLQLGQLRQAPRNKRLLKPQTDQVLQQELQNGG